MSKVQYVEKLKSIRDALKASPYMNPYDVLYRIETMLDHNRPYVELYLDRETNTETTIGRGVPYPRQTILTFVIRAVAPGGSYLEACEARDELVDAVREAITEQKASGDYSLDGLSFGDVTFDDFTREQGGFASVAQIALSWLTLT